MNVKHLSTGQLLQLAGIVTPIAAVAAVRVVLGLGPDESPAATIESTAVIPIESDPETQTTQATEAQKAAMAFILEHDGDDLVRSPMVKSVAPTDVVASSGPELLEPAQHDPIAHLVLTSIVGQGARSFASLNGRVYRIGDEVVQGWRITTIDPGSREVLLTNKTGDTRVLELISSKGDED